MEELLVIAACLATNALLAAYEMAFVSVPQAELKKCADKGSKAAKRLLSLRKDPERTLSIIQVGITMVGAVSAAVSGVGASEQLAPALGAYFGWQPQVAEAVSIGLVVVPLTYLSVVVGELVPKSIALRHPLKLTLLGARSLFIADRIFSPLVTLLEWSTKQILAVVLPKARKERRAQKAAVERDGELESETNVDVENLPSHHRQAILNLAHLERRTLRDIILPWKEVVTIKHSSSLEEVVPLIFASGHTRIPVMDGANVMGVLHTKEFLALREVGGPNWHSAISPALYMRPNNLILSTLRIMQAKRSHLAVIVNKTNDPMGIVTMEDISEEIWGEIYDEDDDSRVRKIFADRVKRKALIERRT
ncbi:MAG: HlyC/CorC family transporter [Proteobacteria bacterium]|nr:MAG: HlyC/CorC family transporter [Pseudomonadota bacterium]